jgi:hypothetical protein
MFGQLGRLSERSLSRRIYLVDEGAGAFSTKITNENDDGKIFLEAGASSDLCDALQNRPNASLRGPIAASYRW